MAQTLQLNISSVWKEIILPGGASTKVSGVWKDVEVVSINDNGTWKTCWQNTQYYTSSGARTSVDIAADFGNPSQPGNFEWTNTGDIESGSAGTYAVTTGSLPAGSTLTIINQGYIRGRGGKGGNCAGSVGSTVAGSPGQDALNITLDTTIDNGAGYIWAGGGGGGASYGTGKGDAGCGGGGGAGDNAGNGGTVSGCTYSANGAAGTQTSGGNGPSSSFNTNAGQGGACGANGTSGATGTNGVGRAGGAAGKAVEENGYTATFSAGNDGTRVKGAIS